MITKSPKNTGRMKTCCCIRGLIWQIKISNLCNIIVKKKYVTRLDVTMDDVDLCLFMKIFKSPGCSNSNFNSLSPWEHFTRLWTLDTFSSYTHQLSLIVNKNEDTNSGGRGYKAASMSKAKKKRTWIAFHAVSSNQ